MALLRCSPISMTIVLVGKYWGAWLMTVSPWLIMLPIIAAWQQFPLWQTAALVGTAVWGLSGASAVSMALAALTADFRIEEPKRRISRIVSYLTMGINSLFVLLVELTAVWLILRSYPHSQVVRVITTISDWPLRWALSGTLLVPLSLLVMQVLFWCAIRTLWQAGTRRLERWEGV